MMYEKWTIDSLSRAFLKTRDQDQLREIRRRLEPKLIALASVCPRGHKGYLRYSAELAEHLTRQAFQALERRTEPLTFSVEMYLGLELVKLIFEEYKRAFLVRHGRKLNELMESLRAGGYSFDADQVLDTVAHAADSMPVDLPAKKREEVILWFAHETISLVGTLAA
jgi:hypothetical protein